MRSLLLVFGVVLSGLFAGDNVASPLEKWRNMPDGKRKALINAYKKFNSMPKERQKRIIELWQRFCQIPERERHQLTERWRNLKSIPQDKKEEIIRRCEKLESLVKNILDAMPADKREAIYKMPPQKRIQEIRRLFNEHSLRLFRRISQHLPENEAKELLSLPEEEFVIRMRKIISERKELLYSELLKSLPKHQQLKLAQLPKNQRYEALVSLLKENLKKQKECLEAVGTDVSVFQDLPFQAEVLAVSCAYRKVVRTAVDRLLELAKTIQDESVKTRLLNAFLSCNQESLPEPFRSNIEIERFFSLPEMMREEILGVLRQRIHSPPRQPQEQIIPQQPSVPQNR